MVSWVKVQGSTLLGFSIVRLKYLSHGLSSPAWKNTALSFNIQWKKVELGPTCAANMNAVFPQFTSRSLWQKMKQLPPWGLSRVGKILCQSIITSEQRFGIWKAFRFTDLHVSPVPETTHTPTIEALALFEHTAGGCVGGWFWSESYLPFLK